MQRILFLLLMISVGLARTPEYGSGTKSRITQHTILQNLQRLGMKGHVGFCPSTVHITKEVLIPALSPQP